MTVRELIERLQKQPLDLPVGGPDGRPVIGVTETTVNVMYQGRIRAVRIDVTAIPLTGRDD